MHHSLLIKLGRLLSAVSRSVARPNIHESIHGLLTPQWYCVVEREQCDFKVWLFIVLLYMTFL